MVYNYLIWKYDSVPHACVLGDLEGLDDEFRLLDGTPLQEGFPGHVSFHMHRDFENDLLLVDNLLNSDMVIVASHRLVECCKRRNVPKVEYLPIEIVDHKGRIASKDYFILHAIEPVDCIDKTKSVFEEDEIIQGNIDSFEKLVIDESRIPADRQVFRLKGFWNITLVRRDLAEALDKEGFSGLGWLELSDYPET